MSQTPCSRCGAAWPDGFQFCGRCGNALQAAPASPAPLSGGFVPPPPAGPAPVAETVPPPSAQRYVVRLVVLRGAVAEGTGYELKPGRTVVGRSGDVAFTADTLMSPQHAVFQRQGDQLDLTEVPGQGGVFRRLREPVQVASGAIVFAGEQYLLLRTGEDVPVEQPEGLELPAETFGTPLPPPRLHVTQLLAGGLPGRVVSTDRDVLTVGREGCDLSFPQDRFMSGRHLRIQLSATGEIEVVDVGSLNGTFGRVGALPARLGKTDELLIGSMLFRVDIRPE